MQNFNQFRSMYLCALARWHLPYIKWLKQVNRRTGKTFGVRKRWAFNIQHSAIFHPQFTMHRHFPFRMSENPYSYRNVCRLQCSVFNVSNNANVRTFHLIFQFFNFSVDTIYASLATAFSFHMFIYRLFNHWIFRSAEQTFHTINSMPFSGFSQVTLSELKSTIKQNTFVFHFYSFTKETIFFTTVFQPKSSHSRQKWENTFLQISNRYRYE